MAKRSLRQLSNSSYIFYNFPLDIFRIRAMYSADISMNGQKWEEVTSFKYLGAIPWKGGTVIRVRIASAMARQSRIWLCSTITVTSMFKLYKSLVTSILFYETWTLLADSDKRNETKCLKNFSTSPTWGTRPTTGCGVRSITFWVHRKLVWQLSRDWNLHGSDKSHDKTASQKTSFREPRKVGDVVVGRENAGLTTSKSGHLCPCQDCSQGLPAGKTGRRSLLNRPSCPLDEPIGQGTELNWAELYNVPKTTFEL